MGRGLERRHERGARGESDSRPYIFADHGYLSGDSTPLLVAKDRTSEMVFAAAVSRKGASDLHVARMLAKWIDSLGSPTVTLRTDGEPSIREVARRAQELRTDGSTTVLEITSPGDSAGNGIAERRVGVIGGIVRTLKAETEERAPAGKEAGPRLVAWMVQHAAHQANVCARGSDGFSPCRRWKGREFGTPLVGFAEKIWFR